MKQADILRALNALEIQTGFEDEGLNQAASYFAEIPILGLKTYALSEEEAIKLVRFEAEFKLTSQLSLAKDILKTLSL